MKQLLVLSLFCLTCLACQTEKTEPYVPGSYQALELFTKVRAYPNADIPADGYGKAYDQHKKMLHDFPQKSNDQWQAMGPLNTAGRCLTIGINPQADNTIYAGMASGGLWRSRNLGLGRSWERIETGFPVLGVSTIEFAPQDSNVMFIGTGEVYNYQETGNDGAYRATRGSYGIGILKSLDGGTTWEKSLDWSYQNNHGVWMVKIGSNNPMLVYAATTQGVLKSEDQGENWTNVFSNVMVTDVEIHPENNEELVIACGNLDSPGKGIFYTEDGGLSWETSSGVPDNFRGKILLARSTSEPDVVYASVGNGFGFSDGYTWLLRSNDGGKNFTTMNEEDYSKWQGWFSHDIAVNPDNANEVIAIGIEVWKSTNAGVTLELKNQGGVTLGTPSIEGPDGPPDYSHSDQHFVMYHPNVEGLVLFGNDGGVFLSFDDGETFRSANGGLQTTQFYNGFSVSHTNPDFALGGLQDNSTSIFRGGEEWTRAVGGDGSWSAINQNDNDIFYASSQNLAIRRTINNGNSFQYIAGDIDDTPLFIAPYVICETSPSTLYAGGRNVHVSNNGGTNWSRTNGGENLNGDRIFAMDVSDIDPFTLYVGTAPESAEAALFVTRNAGSSYTSVSPNPDRIVNDVSVYPGDPDKAIAVFSGFGTPHVFRTEDGGDSWEDITANLPDVPTNAVAIDPYDSNHIYIGNDIGVYLSTDGGQSYQVFQNGLPTALIAMDLKISKANNKLWVASHGNGTYNVPLQSVESGTQNTLALNGFSVSPNPTAGQVEIKTEAKNVSKAFVSNVQGKLVGTYLPPFEINLSPLPAGTYFITLLSEGKYVTEKIIKD